MTTARFDTISSIINKIALIDVSMEATNQLLREFASNFIFDTATHYFYDAVHNNFRKTYSVNTNDDSATNFTNSDKRLDNSLIMELFTPEQLVNISNHSDCESIASKLGINCSSSTTSGIVFAILDDKSIVGLVVLESSTTQIEDEELKYLLPLLNIFQRRIREQRIIRKYEEQQIEEQLSNEFNWVDHKVIIVDSKTHIVLHHNQCVDVLESHGIIQRISGDSNDAHDAIFKVIPNFIMISELGRHGDYLIQTKEISWQTSNDALLISVLNTNQFLKEKLSHDRLTNAHTWNGLKEQIYNDLIYVCDKKYAYVSVDIENLKIINAENSRATGDKILQEMCSVLHYFIDSTEYYCRVVSDTFAVIINYENDEILHNRLNDLSQRLSSAFVSVLPNKSIVATGGVYIIEGSLYNQLEKGFENSKIARNTIKGNFQNGFAIFTDDLKNVLTNSKRIEDKVGSALDNNEFSVYLQPKFSLKTRQIVGAEALVRWISKTETIYPDNFIPVFEKNGFVKTLDFIVYEKVFQFIRDCLDKNVDMVPVSINMSRNHLEDEQFLEKLITLVNTYNIPRHLIEVEITENASAHSDHKLCAVVEKIKKENIKVSMDDFGAAYSSLSLLKELEIDTLKLDKEFLPKMTNAHNDVLTKDEIIIKNIVHMAKELDFNVICEGIETEAQLEFLASVGCDNGQGYIFSKPLPTDLFLKNLIANDFE